jgi:type I restriction enzyme S subunit
MNADRLLAHFEKISDAPDAVSRLRRFILDLAVRGKLVEQAPGECSETSEAPAAEEPFPLPSNWSCVALGGVLHMINGRAFKPSDWLSKGLPIVRIQNLNNESAPFNCCDPNSVDEKHIIEDGTFLISWSGTPGTSFGAFIWRRGKAALNQHIFKCLPTGTEYQDRFLQLAINGRLDEMIAKAHGGVGLQHITKGKLEALALPLPPLAEQHRIVEKVDELMMLCDRLEASQNERESRRDRLVMASLNRLSQPTDPDEFKKDAGFHLRNLNRLSTKPEHIKEVRKAILNLAVRGKLVPQDEREGTAADLLIRIDEEKARLTKAKKISRRKPVPRPTIDEGGFPVPSRWEWCRLEHLIYTVGDGPHFSPQYVDADRGIPFLSTRNISSGGFQLDDLKYVSREDHQEFVKRIRAERDDVLYTKGGTTGIAVVNDLSFEFSVWVHIAILKVPVDHIYSRFLALALNSPHCYEQSQRLTHGIGNRDLGLTRMILITIPLPPLAEQKRIVAKVDELMAICDQLEKQLESQQKESRRLLEALLHEALEGVG